MRSLPPPPDIDAALRERGLDLARIARLAAELAAWFEAHDATPIEQVALMRLLEHALRYSEERVDGEGFRRRADEVVRILGIGDGMVVSSLRREFS